MKRAAVGPILRTEQLLTPRQMLERLNEVLVIGPWEIDDVLAMAEAIGKGFDRFTAEDVYAFSEWADDVLIKSTCLALVLDRRMIVRMTAEDDEPAFVLNPASKPVPRAAHDRRRVLEPKP